MSTLIQLPEETCSLAMAIVRKLAQNYRQTEKGEEPPLRVLKMGLHGESIPATPGQPAPHKYMLQKDGQWYHQFRLDGWVCDEVLHETLKVQKRFGDGSIARSHHFRAVLGYASGSAEWQLVDTAAEELSKQLFEAAWPAAQKALAAPESSPQPKLYSMYVLALLPGQTIKMHLDVPELAGLDRSTAPNWLLVCAHCSGLFAKRRVHNATCVFYPHSPNTGALATYSPIVTGGEGGDVGVDEPPVKKGRFSSGKVGCVVPNKRGTCVVFDADSCFHHSETLGGDLAPPALPEKCKLDIRGAGGNWEWVVIDAQTNKDVAVYPEGDIRVSISFKMHVHGPEDDAPISVNDIIRELSLELQRRGRLHHSIDLASSPQPLVELAPLMVDEFVKAKAPTISTIETVWKEHDLGQDLLGL